MKRFRIGRFWSVAAVLLLAGCEVGYGVGAWGMPLESGVYRYRAWSDYDRYRPAWSGYLDLRVHADGTLSGSYRLPDQCSDAFGYRADCVGYVAGRVYSDGILRFGLDEGWLSNRGRVRSDWRASGYWETRLLGYRDGGTFELELY